MLPSGTQQIWNHRVNRATGSNLPPTSFPPPTIWVCHRCDIAKRGWRSGVVKPKTEELLYFLLWTMDAGFTLSWRNLNSSFEGWAWRNQLGRRLAELKRQKLLETRPGPNLERILRLTREGRRAATTFP